MKMIDCELLSTVDDSLYAKMPLDLVKPIIKSKLIDFYALKNMTNLTYIYYSLTGEYIQL